MNHPKHLHYIPQRGMSLVEVLVAMVISLFLLAGLIQVYLANKSSYSFTNSVLRNQENARYAMDKMSLELRMAGFFGCAVFDRSDPAAMDAIVNNLNPSGPGYDPYFHDFLSRPLVEGTENDGLNGSDSITLRGASPLNVSVQAPFAVSKSANIFVTRPNELKAGDTVMVTNCRGADIFQVTNTTVGTNSSTTAVVHNVGTGVPGNYNPDSCKAGHCLSQAYGADATMFELQSVTYSIAAGESGEPALWRTAFDAKSTQVASEELVDGIEQIQVEYGVDTTNDGHPNQYMTADQITADFSAPNNWDDVMSIRLMLLARSERDGIVEAPQVINYNGAVTTANDNRLRQVFTTTIALRNRVRDS
ncbi:MAG: PilW family protein [Gammaproteobacteria bacterium]|nr:PilW family protein [Gammaproteobacteria bacterium]